MPRKRQLQEASKLTWNRGPELEPFTGPPALRSIGRGDRIALGGEPSRTVQDAEVRPKTYR